MNSNLMRRDNLVWIQFLFKIQVCPIFRTAHFNTEFSMAVAGNVLRLCEGGEIEEQMFKLTQMFNRIPMFKISTEAPLLQNRC